MRVLRWLTANLFGFYPENAKPVTAPFACDCALIQLRFLETAAVHLLFNGPVPRRATRRLVANWRRCIERAEKTESSK